MSRESDYHRSAYVKMCRKNNNTRKELINKIKRVDLIIVYLCICMDKMRLIDCGSIWTRGGRG